MATLKIALPDAMREWINAQVASGNYADASEYICDLIQRDQRRQQALISALIEGEQSGVSSRTVKGVISSAKP